MSSLSENCSASVKWPHIAVVSFVQFLCAATFAWSCIPLSARERTQGPSAAQHVTQETIQPSTATCHLQSLLPKKRLCFSVRSWSPTPQRLEVTRLAGWNLGVNITRFRHAQKSTCVRSVGAPMSQVHFQIGCGQHVAALLGHRCFHTNGSREQV